MYIKSSARLLEQFATPLNCETIFCFYVQKTFSSNYSYSRGEPDAVAFALAMVPKAKG